MDEARAVFEIAKAFLDGELTQERILTFMKTEIAKAAGEAMAVAH